MRTENDECVHPLASVMTENIGPRTKILQYTIILSDAVIGADCNINAHCLIENDVVIGDRVTIKNGVQLWDGIRVGDNVFIGPNVTFANDKFPRSGQHHQIPLTTQIDSGASIGGGATVLPGLSIGRNAMVGAGAVVTRSVPANAIVVGNPARIVGYVDANSENAIFAAPTHQIGSSESEVTGVKLHRLPHVPDLRGSLTFGEFGRSIPFEAKRYFIVFNVPSPETRGEHAHRKCQQFLICVRGSVSVVADDGKNREEFLLDRPDIGLHLSPMVWGIQYKYSSDAVMLVFASDFYDAEDYIRDYSEFLKEQGQA